MKKKEPDGKPAKLTILLLNHHFASERIFQIPQKLLTYWKYYLGMLLGVFVTLVGMTVFFGYQNYSISQNSERLQGKLEKVKEYPQKIDAVKNKMQELESKMQEVDAYLNKRGIKGALADGGKGGASIDITDANLVDIIDGYLLYVNSLHSNLANIPIGAPVLGPLTSTFGVRSNPFTEEGFELHTGVDIKADRGEAVRSPANGRIVHATWKGGYGKCVIIQHQQGYETLYGHLSSIKVKDNQEISAGDIIGYVGSTGRSTGPHLHYEISQFGKRINPDPFLNNE